MAWNFGNNCLVAAVALTFLILLWKAVNYLFSKSDIPSPKGDWFIIGHLFEIRKSKDMMQTFDEWVKTYGPIVQFRPLGIFGKTIYLISDADALKQILVSKSFKYGKTRLLRRPLVSTKNVFAANGKEHSRMRKMINPAFKVSNLKSMVAIFQEKANTLVEYWNGTIEATKSGNDSKESRLPVQNDLSRMALDALGECVFGYDFDTMDGDTALSSAFTDLLHGVNPGVITFMQLLRNYLPFLIWYSQTYKRRQRGKEIVSKFLKQVIADKLDTKTDKDTAQKDLLDLLLEAVDDETGKGMDEEELFAQVFVFLVAGHETSAVAMSWLLFFLAQYPEVQKRLRQEVEVTLNEKEECWETYESMEYLTAVVNESLRLRPSASVFSRRVMKEDNILGYNIPADSMIVVPIYALHRKPEYWSDPETFNPERFLEQNRQNNPNHRYAFMPFSAGPRICVGYRFALMEIKVVLSALIRKFSFSMIPGMSFGGSMSVTYKPEPNMELLVRKITE
ncbi:cytochrome P450 4F5-like isoform X2 [Dendronephthya gigantea]|uniref:cytochrome P450 4F5-like isoform X1 n=1 Tax=Dendronephthya gigantea TaxID=151771 RepID=UPI00106B742E|nr:cytochrome P450 4F5-like isoform X1 [Dendronephthya gigantea]XP_028416659.1 cytochrome P450 4F5-like isoform X1 [Dendronephthya gigantea]XP_028416660.1 cytochrome P450 4F5-like isoform X1 [Dendronephthya gigantea]XP_028416661.1 cytochrome P450 4F5-like isoform X2 [Dendronephthya gigantea]